MRQLILPESYIKERSIINNKVDMKLLTPIIEKVQELKLRPAVGTDLYNRIVYESTPTSAPGVEPKVYANLSSTIRDLLNDYVLPCLHWYLVAECCVVLKFRFMNSGIVEKTGITFTGSTTDDLKFIEARYTNDAQNYENLMIKRIKFNQTLFPEYNTNSALDKERPDRRPFKSAWYFPSDCYRTSNDSGPLHDT